MITKPLRFGIPSLDELIGVAKIPYRYRLKDALDKDALGPDHLRKLWNLIIEVFYVYKWILEVEVEKAKSRQDQNKDLINSTRELVDALTAALHAQTSSKKFKIKSPDEISETNLYELANKLLRLPLLDLNIIIEESIVNDEHRKRLRKRYALGSVEGRDQEVERLNRWFIDRYIGLDTTPEPRFETLPSWGVNPGDENVSICIMGPDGAGKSILGLHLASRYAADSYNASNNTRIIYVSTDLHFAKAEQMWGRTDATGNNGFDLARPNKRQIPHAIFDPTQTTETTHPNPYFWPTPEPPKFALQKLLPEIAPDTDTKPESKQYIDRFLSDTPKDTELSVGFLDLASNTAGDDWGYINRLLAQLPDLEAGEPKHLVVIDAIEGLEVFSGERDLYGEERNRRSRVAQLVRSAAQKCHLVFVIEEAQQGQRLAEEFIADMVVRLRVENHGGYTQRTVEIVKSRAQAHIAGPHDYEIYSGEPTMTGDQPNPDEPKCENAYWHVFQNIDSLFDQIARRSGSIDLPATPLPTFGINYLDAMLGHDLEQDIPRETNPPDPEDTKSNAHKSKTTQSNVTALIGEVATYKTQLGYNFLAECFSTRSWYDGWPSAAEVKKRQGRPYQANGTLRLLNSAPDLFNEDGDKIDTEENKIDQKTEFQPIAILLTTQLVDKEQVASNIFDCLPSNDTNLSEEVENWLKKSPRIICRRLPANEVSAAQFFHIVESAVRQARTLMGLPLSNEDDRWKGPAECEAIRLVVDDWSTIKTIFPSVSKSPLLLQFLLQYFQWLKISVLMIDSQGANPAVTRRGEQTSDLHGRVGRAINAWHVQFFNEDRVAISIEPPPPFASSLRPTIRELRPRPNSRKLLVDPHFESYDQLGQGEPRPLPLQICLYSGSIGRNQYIDETEGIFSQLFRGVDNGPIFAREGSNNYDILRGAALAPRGQRLDHTRLVQVDEFWERIDYYLSTTSESEMFCRAYLNARTIDNDGEPTPEDPYLIFQPAASTETSDNKFKMPGKWFQSTKNRRRHTFFQLDELGYLKDVPKKKREKDDDASERGSSNSEPDSKPISRLDRIPMMWDFGFVLHRRRAWRIAGDMQFDSLSGPKIKVDQVRLWLEGNSLPLGGESFIYQISDLAYWLRDAEDQATNKGFRMLINALEGRKYRLDIPVLIRAAENDPASSEQNPDETPKASLDETPKDETPKDDTPKASLSDFYKALNKYIWSLKWLKSEKDLAYEKEDGSDEYVFDESKDLSFLLQKHSDLPVENQNNTIPIPDQHIDYFGEAWDFLVKQDSKEDNMQQSVIRSLLLKYKEHILNKRETDNKIIFSRYKIRRLHTHLLTYMCQIKIENVSWYDFIWACRLVAQTQKRHGVPQPVLAFDVDRNGVESLSCVVLEIWASELKYLLDDQGHPLVPPKMHRKERRVANEERSNAEVKWSEAKQLLDRITTRDDIPQNLLSRIEKIIVDIEKELPKEITRQMDKIWKWSLADPQEIKSLQDLVDSYEKKIRFEVKWEEAKNRLKKFTTSDAIPEKQRNEIEEIIVDIENELPKEIAQQMGRISKLSLATDQEVKDLHTLLDSYGDRLKNELPNDKFSPKIQKVFDPISKRKPESLITILRNPLCQEALLRALLLLFGATEPQQFEAAHNPDAPATSAVASRHWYSTASRYMSEWDPLDPWVAFRLPGHYSVRGDWFLTLAGGSQSPQLAKGAIDLLSSTRANLSRLQHGVGLPTRYIGGLQNQRTALYTIQQEPNIMLDPEVAEIEVRNPDDQDADPPRLKRLMRYGEVKAMGAETERPIQWIWRSRLAHYQRHSRIWNNWLNDIGRTWHQRQLTPDYENLDALTLYKQSVTKQSNKKGNLVCQYKSLNFDDTQAGSSMPPKEEKKLKDLWAGRDESWKQVERIYHRAIERLLIDLQDATPIEPDKKP